MQTTTPVLDRCSMPAQTDPPSNTSSHSVSGIRWGVAATMLLSMGLGHSALAQDANYWSIQYGPVAQLVGGQVIASSRDLSATFYNPGALALEQTGTFLLSTESFQYETLSGIPDTGIDVLDLSSSRFAAAPSLVAGSLPRWFGKDTRLAWSFLTRQELKARLGQRTPDAFDFVDGTSVTESYIDQSVTENWGGLTVSVPLSERVGLGGTLYGVYRGQRSRSELSAAAVDETGAGLSISNIEDFDYYHTRVLAKLGLAFETRRMKFGLSVTTPSLGAFGSGEVGFTRSVFGVDSDGNTVPGTPFLETGLAENLTSEYHSSWAIGGGASWKQNATQVHISAEWFAPVSRFTVLETTTEDGTSTRLSQELASVLNAGIGLEHSLGRDTSVYAAFRTDFSANVRAPSVNVAISDWDVYHISAGVAFSVVSTRFTLGATGSFGSDTRDIPTAFPPEQLPRRLDTTLDIRYRRVIVLLGFLFGS